jgi:hypothetical protein
MKTDKPNILSEPPSNDPLNNTSPPLTANGVRLDFKITLSRQTGVIINQWGRLDLPLLLNPWSLRLSAQTLSEALDNTVVQHFKIELNQFFDKLAYEERRKEMAELQTASPSPAFAAPTHAAGPVREMTELDHLNLILEQQARDLKAAA